MQTWDQSQNQDEVIHRFMYDIMSGFRTSLQKLHQHFEVADKEVAVAVSLNNRKNDGFKLVRRLYDLQRHTRSHLTLAGRSRSVMTKYFKLSNSRDPFKDDIRDGMGTVQYDGQQLFENVSSILQLHLSLMDFRTNQLLYVLTIVSVLFVPITFVSGVYGSNFAMPEIKWKFGVTYFWCLIIGLVSATVIFLRAMRFL